MFAIIIVTINSIIATKNSAEATLHSANATNSIRILQESLDRERLNEKINRKIALADNLVSELKFNKFLMQLLALELNDEYFKNSTETTPIRVFKERLLQATNDPEFGNATIRDSMDIFSKDADLLNGDLEEIKVSAVKGDFKIKNERVSAAKEKLVLIKTDMISLIPNLEEYKKAEINKIK